GGRVGVGFRDATGQLGQPEAFLEPCREVVAPAAEPEPRLDEVEVERALVDLEQGVTELLERLHLGPRRDLDDPRLDEVEGLPGQGHRTDAYPPERRGPHCNKLVAPRLARGETGGERPAQHAP